MSRIITLLSVLCILCTQSLTAQNLPRFARPANPYRAFLQRILQEQEPAAEKTTTIKERLIGSSTYDLFGGNVQDTARYKYSGSNGCRLSPDDDIQSLSYSDNSAYGFFGDFNPQNATLSYDSLSYMDNLNGYVQLVKH